MATLKEMSNVIDSIPIDSPLAYGVQPYTLDEAKHYLRCVLMNAEDEGRYSNCGFWVHDEPCTYWMVGDFVIIYPNDYLNFSADLLSDDMMDDLIIEEV